MTEKQWQKAADPEAMLAHLGVRASDRKLRLFACACCRRAWLFAKDRRLNQALTLLEAFTNGTAKDRDRGRAHVLGGKMMSAVVDVPQHCLGGELWKAAKKTLDRDGYTFGESAAAAFGWAADIHAQFNANKKAERAQQAILVREVFGNPFRPVSFSPLWRTDTAMALARQTNESREFGAMPILADALQDAGCDSDDILNHLRDTSVTHVRGCWALDLVLGKE